MQDSEGNEIRTVRPFSTTTQYLDWQTANCSRCTKAATDAEFYQGQFRCLIQKEIVYAAVVDGKISDDAARRMKYAENRGKYVWPCGEWEPTEAWKNECKRKKAT